MYPAGSLVETRVNMWSEIEYEPLKQKKPEEEQGGPDVSSICCVLGTLACHFSCDFFMVYCGMFHYFPFTAEEMEPHRG